MNHDIALQLRDLGDLMAAEHNYKASSMAFMAAHRIEFLEQKIKDLEGMVKDAERSSDYWFKRVHPPKKTPSPMVRPARKPNQEWEPNIK